MKKFKEILGAYSLLLASVGVVVLLGGIPLCFYLFAQPNVVDGSFLSGEHSLRKMTPAQTGTSTTTSGGFFLFSGGFHSSSETKTMVKFAWQMNEDTYILSSLPLEKIRVKIDANAHTPTMKFRFLPRCILSFEDDLVPEDMVESILNNCLVYATLTVKSGDWPTQIQLPLNRDSGDPPSENK